MASKERPPEPSQTAPPPAWAVGNGSGSSREASPNMNGLTIPTVGGSLPTQAPVPDREESAPLLRLLKLQGDLHELLPLRTETPKLQDALGSERDDEVERLWIGEEGEIAR